MATNLIYFCVFHNKNYIDLAYLLLKSMHKYGELDDTVDVLIYTSTEFSTQMRQNPLCQSRVIFKTNDTYTTIPAACKARLDIFEIPEVAKYEKIMYLDTDILIVKPLKPIFNIVSKDVLYALEEGSLDMKVPYDYWGKMLFAPGEIDALEDKTGFSSGVLLFRNSESIRDLFQRIKTHMETGSAHEFHDQPYFVYNTIKAGLKDNQTLKAFVVINECSPKTDKTILHFAGSPGATEYKEKKMETFMKILELEEMIRVLSCCAVKYPLKWDT